jgi:hypothetical protein
MAQSLSLREQAEHYRRLARDSTDPGVRDGLLALTGEYTAKADALENAEGAVWRAAADDGTA